MVEGTRSAALEPAPPAEVPLLGLTKCGECGAGFVVYSRDHLGCFGTRDRGTCTNKLTIARQEVEARVLRALQDKLMRKDFFEEFREFAKEMNRLRMEQRAGLTSAKREVARIDARQKKLLDMMLDDAVPVQKGKAEMKKLEERRLELDAQLKAADEPPPLLHPSIAHLYRSKLEELAASCEGIWPRCWLLPNKRKGRQKRATSSCRFDWLRGRDLNPRPLGYEPNELPDCSTPRRCKEP